MDRTSLAYHQAQSKMSTGTAGLGRQGSRSTVASFDKKFGSISPADSGLSGGENGQLWRLSSWMPGKLSGCTHWLEVRKECQRPPKVNPLQSTVYTMQHTVRNFLSSNITPDCFCISHLYMKTIIIELIGSTALHTP